MPPSIADYGLIGDLHTAALVHRNGSIDWLCLPRFDSEACFAALLGGEDNGYFAVRASDEGATSTRRYLDDTLILETTYHAEDGSFRVLDFMPPRSHHPSIIRVIEGIDGEPSVSMSLKVRFSYGKAVPWVRRVAQGLRFIAGPQALMLYSSVPISSEDFTTTAEFTIKPNQRQHFILIHHASTEAVPPPVNASVELERTAQYWTGWTSTCHEEFGEYHQLVTRSAITLKALTYFPTGAIVAAATSSLPEKLGGERNWDYRYCWLRDATFTLYALLLDGHEAESLQWREWLLRAAAGDPSQLQIMYGIGGERMLVETTLPWLGGFGDSAPVRIGNAASEQFQLDVYGELMDSLYLFHRLGVPPDEDSWALQVALTEFVEAHWMDPDEGIWEVRGPRRHFTHSKAMAWVAMDRMVKMAQDLDPDAPIERWSRVRDEIHDEVMTKGFNDDVGAFTQYYGSTTLDASVLLLPLVGFIPATDPKMASTLDAIERELTSDGLVLRYSGEGDDNVDGLPPGEGYFLACSFWYIDNLIMAGQTDKAEKHFRRIITMANDLGLFSEEFDATNGTMLGNFPQAFSHVGLINTVRNLTHRKSPIEHRVHDVIEHRLPHFQVIHHNRH